MIADVRRLAAAELRSAGQNSLEYIGLAIVAGLVILAVAASLSGVLPSLHEAVCRVIDPLGIC